ncbi:unnamed protein product [Amaranthus hypochondriacus]
MGKKRRDSSPEHAANVTTVCFSLNVAENLEVGKLLKYAVIVEDNEVLNLRLISSKLAGFSSSFMGMYYLSPTKLLISFDSETCLLAALDESSIFWEYFDDVRQWTKGECFGDRLVWLECYGIQPKCYSLENMKMIGEKWGPVLSVIKHKDDVNCLTYAKFAGENKSSK